MKVAAPEAGDVSRFFYGDSMAAKPGNESVIVCAAERRVGLLCGAKILLNAKVNLHAAALKPAPASLGKFGGLGKFFHPQNFPIELPGDRFFSRRHGKLNMVNGHEDVLADRGRCAVRRLHLIIMPCTRESSANSV